MTRPHFSGKRGVSGLVFLCQLIVFGCAGSDRWYDTEDLYTTSQGAAAEEWHLQEEPPQPELDNPPPLPLADDTILRLSLEQAVLYSLRRNRELQVQRYTPLIQGTFEQIERGTFDPEIFGQLQHSEETASETSRSTEERFSIEAEEWQAEMGVRQFLPTGTEVEAAAAHSRSTSNRTPKQQEVRLGLSVTQALARGLGPAVNLIDVRQAELSTRASFYELRGYIEAMVAEVETAYWRYVLAAEGIDIFQRSLEIARQQLSEVENRIEVGVIPKNQAAAAKAEVARRQQALIDAGSTYSERRLQLLRLLNAGGAEHLALQLQATSEPRMPTTELDDVRSHLELAVRSRPDLNEALLRLRQDRLELVRTRNGLLPKLDLFIDLGKTGYAESFATAVHNIDQDNYDLVAGIRLSSSLGNRAAKAEHRAAGLSKLQAEAALENLKQLIRIDVLLAVNEIERTRKQIEASAVTRTLQEQTLKAEQERFSVGDITSLLVAQAQRDLLVSQLTEIEAIVDYRLGQVNLFLAEGSLLERRGIRLDNAAVLLPASP